MVKVLGGVRVLDLGSFITAPYAAMLLGEMGADVIKVERPGAADPFRSHTLSSNSPFFLAYNRNKRGLTLDYVQPEGLALLRKLVATADVLVINVRPGVAEKLELGAEQLCALNPRLIYCAITGYGADGPYAKRPAFDGVGQTLSGLLSRYHRSDDPRIAGPAMCDSLTGMFACMGILGALHERERSGRGRRVDVNMIEASMAFAIEPLAHYLVLGEDQPFYFRGAASQAYILRCQDGKRIGLHLSSPEKFWAGLARTIGRPDLLVRFPTREAKIQSYRQIGLELQEEFAKKRREEWLPLLEANDVPFAVERSLAELEDDPQVRHLEAFNRIEDEVHGCVRGINRPVRFDGDNRSAFLPPPAIGEHSGAILAELGIDPASLADLRSRKII
ncbi:MAG: CoA transferase [Burkholderiales bacterium]|nr:CoA transferase [Burkholderiales bacterium]